MYERLHEHVLFPIIIVHQSSLSFHLNISVQQLNPGEINNLEFDLIYAIKSPCNVFSDLFLVHKTVIIICNKLIPIINDHKKNYFRFYFKIQSECDKATL